MIVSPPLTLKYGKVFDVAKCNLSLVKLRIEFRCSWEAWQKRDRCPQALDILESNDLLDPGAGSSKIPRKARRMMHEAAKFLPTPQISGVERREGSGVEGRGGEES